MNVCAEKNAKSCGRKKSVESKMYSVTLFWKDKEILYIYIYILYNFRLFCFTSIIDNNKISTQQQ